MRKIIAAAAVCAAFIVPASASASVPASHGCSTPPHGWVSASPSTSCGFARNIVASVFDACNRYPGSVCGFWAPSPATHRVYHVTCRFTSGNSTCYSNGHSSWIKFRLF